MGAHGNRSTPTNAATVDNKLFEITEDEANQIVERIRRTVTGNS